MSWEFNFIRLIKRAGAAHTLDVTKEMDTRCLVLVCSACPHKNINVLEAYAIPVYER